MPFGTKTMDFGIIIVMLMNQNTFVLLFRRNLVRLWASQSKSSVNTAEESHTIGLLSVQIDK